MLIQIYNFLLYHPLFNLMVFFYNVVPGHDIAWAIILLTLFVKLVLWPFFGQSIRAQRKMQAIAPKLEALKEKYKDNKEKIGMATMELYKAEKISPFSSCLPLLLQLPILIAVYQVFSVGLAGQSLDLVYSFIYNPGSINPMAFGIINFSQASSVMAFLAGVAQFWQSKMMLKRAPQPTPGSNNPMANMGKQMTYIMPVITVFIGAGLPAGLTFYWLLVTLFGVVQQAIVFKKMDKEVVVVK